MGQNVIVDFDGVIHSYRTGWEGPRAIPDPPVEGAIDFLLELIGDERLQPVILSTRSQAWFGRWAMKRWLGKHGMLHWKERMHRISQGEEHVTVETLREDPWHKSGFMPGMGYPEEVAQDAGGYLVDNILWPSHKIPSVMQIDDRGFRFEGSFPDLEEICEFTPWNRE